DNQLKSTPAVAARPRILKPLASRRLRTWSPSCQLVSVTPFICHPRLYLVRLLFYYSRWYSSTIFCQFYADLLTIFSEDRPMPHECLLGKAVKSPPSLAVPGSPRATLWSRLAGRGSGPAGLRLRLAWWCRTAPGWPAGGRRPPGRCLRGPWRP